MKTINASDGLKDCITQAALRTPYRKGTEAYDVPTENHRVSDWFVRQKVLAAVASMVICLGHIVAVDAAPKKNLILVDNAADLQAALIPENAGHRIKLQAGTYLVDALLTVPDGVTLEGKGIMLGDVLPVGFEPGTETRIVADGPLFGNLMTLGDGVKLKGLVIENAAGSFGNVIAVDSRSPDDTVSASIVDCEIINPNEANVGPNGPVGHAIVVISNNLNRGADPPPYEGADLTLRLDRSILRSEFNSPGVIAINFASKSMINLFFTENVLGGGINVAAGVSRPDEVTGSMVMVKSVRNAYVAEAAAYLGVGMQVIGGSSVVIPIVAPATTSNSAYISSRGDQIQGFEVGVAATAGRRLFDLQGPSSDNHVDLRLLDLRIRTDDVPGAADFKFLAADSTGADPEISPGDNNTLSVQMRRVSGSGARDNVYAVTFGPVLPENMGTGNRLEFRGSPKAFDKTNEAIEPPPPAQYFQSNKGKK